jgi:hypothetical protein
MDIAKLTLFFFTSWQLHCILTFNTTWQKWSEAECLTYTICPLKSKIKHLFSMDFPGSKECWQVRTGYACLYKKSFIAVARKCVMTLSAVHWYQTFSHVQQNCSISVWYIDKCSC